MEKNSQIAGYTAIYFKKGDPIKTEGELTEIPLTIESKIIRPELKESYDKRFGGKGVPFEEELFDWLRQTELEVCVNCGVLTNTQKNQHIDLRSFYVEGAGQLCEGCYNKTYKIKKPTYE